MYIFEIFKTFGNLLLRCLWHLATTKLDTNMDMRELAGRYVPYLMRYKIIIEFLQTYCNSKLKSKSRNFPFSFCKKNSWTSGWVSPPDIQIRFPLDFFSWRYLKSKVYASNLRNTETPKRNIRAKIDVVPSEMLDKVVKSQQKELLYVHTHYKGWPFLHKILFFCTYYY